jgi:hypothetical protein
MMGLTNSPLRRRRGAEGETSAHIHCECQALALLSYIYIYTGSIFMNPDDIKSLSLGVTWNFSKGTGLPCTDIRLWGSKSPLNKAYVHRVLQGSNPNANQIINQPAMVPFYAADTMPCLPSPCSFASSLARLSDLSR